MAKEPFERVFSLIERKKLLNRVAKELKKITVKNSQSEVYEFQPIGIDPDTCDLFGNIVGFTPQDSEKVVAMFYVDRDRYFMTTRLKRQYGYWVLLSDQQFFKFNRRAAFRVEVPNDIEVNFFISTIRNIEMNRSVPILDVSATGARIAWSGETRLAKGTILHGALQWGKGKVLPVDASVIHSPAKGTFGVRFINLNSITQNRLKMLVIEIQQTIHFK
jgi:hypothetical protein